MACMFNQLSQLMVQLQEDETLMRQAMLLALVYSITLVVVPTAAYLYYRWWSTHPLYGQNKGSKVYPIVGTIIPFLRNKHRILDFNYDMIKRLPGHTVRGVLPGASGPVFYTANPVNVEHILKTNFESYPKGEMFIETLRDLLGDGIFNADDRLWKVQRKVASYEFTTRSLRDFVLECATRETYDRLVPLLSEASKSGLVFDLQDIFARFTFDNICQLAFGIDPACLDISLPEVKLAGAFETAALISTRRLQSFPRFMWKVWKAFDIGEAKKMRKAVRVIDNFAMDVIKTRRQEFAVATAKGDQETLGRKTDLLSRFMTLVDNEEQGAEIRAELSSKGRTSMDDQKWNDIFLRDIVISFLLAGRDTTTSALVWFFWLLSTNPHVETTILEEISRVLSSPAPPPAPQSDGATNSAFSFEELKSMHYLHAAFTESMRLYPPVPADIKMAEKDDVWPDGTCVKANSIVVYHPFAMGRLEDLWGKDALEFKPERWLKDGVFVPQSPYKYPIFQAGPRTCLGKDMVMMQLKFISATILCRFKICVPEGTNAYYVNSLTLRVKDGLPVTVQKRMNPL